MIRGVKTTLTKPSCRQGDTIEGVLAFQTSSARKASDFNVSITLTASLHLSLPTADGIQCHSDRKIFTQAEKLHMPVETERRQNFVMPFSIKVSSACPISSTYKAMASLSHCVEASVTDLCLGHDPLSKSSMAVAILPALESTKGAASIKKQGKITCTANINMLSASKYFLQVAYPEKFSTDSYNLTLACDLHISDGTNSFVRRTERSLNDFKSIQRVQPDGSRLTILEISVPQQIESTLRIGGFRRSHTLSIDFLLNQKEKVRFQYNVETQQSTDSKSVGHAGRATIISLAEDPFNLDVPFSIRPRTAPVPRKVQSSSHQRTQSYAIPDSKSAITSLRSLSMDQLALRALSSTSAVSPSSNCVSRSVSVTSSSSSSKASSLHTSGSGSPSKSIASSVSSLQMSPLTPLQSSVVSTPSKGHSRKRSSLSILTKRTSAFFGLSNLNQRHKSSKNLEISCCGSLENGSSSSTAEQVFSGQAFSFPSQASSHNEELTPPSTPRSASTISDSPETPGSCYSSMPPSPKAEEADYFATTPPSSPSTFARRLSFKRTPTRDVPIYNKKLMSPMRENRFSISDEYLSGFNFEGLSSLDSSDVEEAEEEELPNLKRQTHFGFAL